MSIGWHSWQAQMLSLGRRLALMADEFCGILKPPQQTVEGQYLKIGQERFLPH